MEGDCLLSFIILSRLKFSVFSVFLYITFSEAILVIMVSIQKIMYKLMHTYHRLGIYSNLSVSTVIPFSHAFASQFG